MMLATVVLIGVNGEAAAAHEEVLACAECENAWVAAALVGDRCPACAMRAALAERRGNAVLPRVPRLLARLDQLVAARNAREAA